MIPQKILLTKDFKELTLESDKLYEIQNLSNEFVLVQNHSDACYDDLEGNVMNMGEFITVSTKDGNRVYLKSSSSSEVYVREAVVIFGATAPSPETGGVMDNFVLLKKDDDTVLELTIKKIEENYSHIFFVFEFFRPNVSSKSGNPSAFIYTITKMVTIYGGYLFNDVCSGGLAGISPLYVNIKDVNINGDKIFFTVERFLNSSQGMIANQMARISAFLVKGSSLSDYF